MKKGYYFGRVAATRVDYFAFARTGSHLLNYCCQGLFDLVWFPTAGAQDREAVERQRELDPGALYALDLREDGVPFAPVYFDHAANGRHGAPVKGESPLLVLIREPIATVYSYYKAATTRWGLAERIKDPGAWAAEKFERYRAFYAQAFDVLRQHPGDTLLLRYEDMLEGPGALRRLVEFVGVRPKLSPEFVWRVTRFDAFVRPGERTFYRGGRNDAWREDREWAALVERLALPDFTAFGYAPEGAGARR